jgi:CRISPR-associated protein Cas5t
MSSCAALRVQVEGALTSFRYPHFVQGIQPTFDFPPPATLYGHVCSALGDVVPPDSFRLALHFTYQSRFHDYEHTHLVAERTFKLSPFQRELLFQPRLTLYLDRPDWVDRFRQPRRVVTLGRSQDLMTYREVRVIHLERAASSYVEHTLVPIVDAGVLNSYSALRLPAWVSPERHTRWGDYAAVRQTQAWPYEAWVDPTAPVWRQLPRAVIWLDLSA